MFERTIRTAARGIVAALLALGLAGGAVEVLRAQGPRMFVPLVTNAHLPVGAPSDACMAEPMRESANVADAVLVCPGQVIATQWVDAATDGDDVYRIYLEAGDTISLELAGEDGDADLYLYAPGTANVEVDPWAAFSNGDLSEERITYRVTSPGYWLIDVYAFDGAIAYVLRVEVTPGD